MSWRGSAPAPLGPDGAVGLRLLAAQGECCCSSLVRMYRAGQLAAACLVPLLPPVGNVKALVFLPSILLAHFFLQLCLASDALAFARSLARCPHLLFFHRWPSLQVPGGVGGAGGAVWSLWEITRTIFCLCVLYHTWGGGYLSGAALQAEYGLPVNVCSWRFTTGNTQAQCDAAGVPMFANCAQVDLNKWAMCTAQAPIWYDCGSLAYWCNCGFVSDVPGMTDGGMSAFYAVPLSIGLAALVWVPAALLVLLACFAFCGGGDDDGPGLLEPARGGCCFRQRVWSEVAKIFADVIVHALVIFELVRVERYLLAGFHCLACLGPLLAQCCAWPGLGLIRLCGEAKTSQDEGYYTDEYIWICYNQRSMHAFPSLMLTLFTITSAAGHERVVSSMTVLVVSTFWSSVQLLWTDIDVGVGHALEGSVDEHALLGLQ